MPKTLQTTTKTRVSGKIAFVVIAVAVIIGAAYTASTLLPLTTSIETKVLMNNPILSNGAYSINLPVGVNTAYQDGWVCDGECPLKQKKWTDSDEAFAGYWSFSQPPLGPFSGSFKSFFDFDVTKIPDNATISSVVFNVWINRVSDPIKNKNIFYRMSGKGFNRTWMEIWNDMGGCSTYSNPSDWVSPNNDCYLMNNFFNSNVDKYVAVNLGSLAVSDLQRLTDQDKNYFSLGVRGLDSVNNPYSSLGVSESAHPPYLAVIYGIPALTLSQSVYSVDNLQGSAVLAVKNTGSGIMSWSAQESCDWLSLSAISGTVNASGQQEVTLNYDYNQNTTNRSCSITITAKATGSPQTVTVNQGAYSRWACKKVIENGDPNTKYNIVFIADAYDEVTMSEFRSRVQTYIDSFFSTEPLKNNKSRFNFYRIDQVGSIIPDQIDAWGRNMRLTFVEQEYWDISQCQKVNMVVVVNSKDGMKRRAVAFFGANPQEIVLGSEVISEGTGVFLHEFGHAFADLGDENINDSAFNMERLERPNIDTYGCPKWCSGEINNTILSINPLSGRNMNKDFNCKDALLDLKSCLDSLPNDNNAVGGKACYDLLSVKYSYYDSVDQRTMPAFGALFVCNVGLNCRSGTGCYPNARDLARSRSSVGYDHSTGSKDSIMFSQASAIFNVISQEAIQNKINSLGLK